MADRWNRSGPPLDLRKDQRSILFRFDVREVRMEGSGRMAIPSRRFGRQFGHGVRHGRPAREAGTQHGGA